LNPHFLSDVPAYDVASNILPSLARGYAGETEPRWSVDARRAEALALMLGRDRSILLEWRASSPQLQRGWSDESAPVSEWEGVGVDAEGRVVSIDLWNWGVTGDVPAALGGLTALKMLILHSNQLMSVPAELGVGRCRLIVSKLVLKAPLVSALDTII
jgi:hypothetical protein